MISLDDFKKLEIKIGTVLSAERVVGADKLLKLVFDMGGGEEQQVVAGIALSYPDPAVLVGKQLPVLTNLEPRELRGVVSHGMVLAAGGEAGAVLLHPALPVPPGSPVR